MKEALEEGNIDPSALAFINCHATSTPAGDQSELYAIHNVYFFDYLVIRW
jgi:3-oxoacyl-[acyl-carrier-protein] synthase II